MSDLIIKSELNELLDDLCVTDALYNAINNLPTIEAIPVVHAEWKETEYYTWECGNCGFHPFKGYIPKEPNFNFCPNCGCCMK